MMVSVRRYTRVVVLAGAFLVGCREDPAAPELSSANQDPVGHPALGLESVPLDGAPFAVAVNHRNAFYVTTLFTGTLAGGTLPSTELSVSVPVGFITSQVRISTDGRTAYASNQDEGTITVIDVATNHVIATINAIPSILTTGLSRDGQMLYALTDFHGVDIIDTRTRTLIGNIPASSTGSILAGVAFHPTEPLMYVAARDAGTVTVIRRPAHTVEKVLSVAGGRIQNVAVSQDGTQLFGTDIERSMLLVWHLAADDTGWGYQEIPIGSGFSRNAFDVAITPDGVQLYVSALADGNVYVVDRATLTVIATLPVGGSPRYIGFNPSGTHAVIPNESGWVTFVHEGGTPPPPPPPPPEPSVCSAPPTGSPPSGRTHPALTIQETSPLDALPFAVAVSSNNVAYITQLLNASTVRADLPSSALSAPFPVGGLPSQVRISPDGATAYIENQDAQTITFVEVATNEVIATVPVPGGSILQLGLTPDGTLLHALTDFAGVFIVDVATRTVVGQIPATAVGSLLTGVAYHPFAPCMYVAARDEAIVTTIDLHTHARVIADTVSGGRIQTLAISRDGGTLYGGDIGRSKLISWDLPSPGSAYVETNVGSPFDRNVFDVAVTPDNAQIYVGTLSDGKVYIFDRATRTGVGEIVTGGSVRYIGFSADGGQAVIANESGWVTFVR